VLPAGAGVDPLKLLTGLQPRQAYTAAVYACLLAAINFCLCRNLFTAEYTGHANSIQGLWISMARLAGEHWFRPSWWPYQDAGVPFEHTYVPLVPASSALLAKLARVSTARAFYSVMGLVLCLGPVTLFVMIWRMTRMPGCAFWVSLLYSVTSPARAILPETDWNPIRYWSSLRLYGTVVWDDLPHHTAVVFLPLALLFLWRCFEKPRPLSSVLTVLLMATTVLASVFGATALLLGSACMLAVFPREQLGRRLRLLALLAIAAYLIVSPFLPPSVIATIRSNQQRFIEDRWSAGSVTALALLICGCALLSRALERRAAERHMRFFVLFAFAASSVPVMDAWLNRHFLPQPNRYTAEMEMGLALLGVPAIGWLRARLPRRIGIALAVFLTCVVAEHFPGLMHFFEQATRPVDVTQGIEYRVAKWVDANMAGQRVMVPGSIAQWFNVFSDTPQLSGASYSSTPTWTQQEAMKRILTSVTPQEVAEAVLWLKAFGTQAAAVAGPRSPEFWKGISSSKFDGRLPVLWRQQDTTIYRVPQRSTSLAHVIPAAAAGMRDANGVLPVDELQKYVDALDDPSLPLAEMRWEGYHRILIHAILKRGQVISVQTCYHRGWRAQAAGQRAAVRRDGLGFLVVEPQCEGPCEIELTYDGGWEYQACRWMSAFTILGLAGYCGFAIWTPRERHVP